MFEFLVEYIKELPDEVREDPEFGFELQKPIGSGQMEALQSDLPFEFPQELKNFYLLSNGAQLGEYVIPPIEKLEDQQLELADVYGADMVQDLLPFAVVKGVGDYVILDLRQPKESQAPILDGFHEIEPDNWEKVASGLSEWLQKMCETNFEPYWLGHQI